MMLEAGSNPRAKNKGGLTPFQLVDPRNTGLRELIQKHEYAILNRGDFVQQEQSSGENGGALGRESAILDIESDDDAEFSGSDDEERAEWERRKKDKAAKKG